MKKNTVELLAELLDREAIRELPNRYCHYVWSADADGYANLFTEDGALIVAATGQEIRGRDNLRVHIRKSMSERKQRPFVHNHVIELIDETAARGWCYFEVRLGLKNMVWDKAGCYEDQYEKTGGEWKFKVRRMITEPV